MRGWGIVVNLGVVALLTVQFHQARWVYHDLLQDPRVYGREIDAVTIAALGDRSVLWIAMGVFGVAAVVGCLLAVDLLVATGLLARRRESAVRRLELYYRWKPVGVVLTAAAYVWAGYENHTYWVAATRHSPVGSGPPVLEVAVLIACGMLPWWWMRRRRPAAG